MDRAKFFREVRNYFGGALDQGQVDGMSALLDAGKDLPLHHMANVLAQVRRETGAIMAPIKETVSRRHKDRNPSDKEVIARLDKAFANGQLPWVKTPYWRDGWFGRGQIQITHRDNYDKFGIADPSDALKLDVSASIAVRGMRDGMFTGLKLSDFVFPRDLSNPPQTNPRRIVNGQDGSDRQVAGFHMEFAKALESAGWGKVVDTAKPKSSVGIWDWLAKLVKGFK